ncbi:helix-turn-helix domain-containing protein [Staphylococcus nepalensis]
MDEQPNYYSITPAHVRYDNDLKPMEIIMYGELTALSNKYGYSYAGNSYFANLYNVHKKTVSTWINHLKEKGYIDTKVIRNEDKTVKERRIYINHAYPQKYGEGSPQKHGEPIHEKTEENNTRKNITSINRDVTAKIFDYINNNLEMIQSPLKVEELEYEINLIKNDAYEIVKIAVDYSKKNNKGINYLIKVIKNWNKEGIDTIEKAKAKVAPKQRKQSKSDTENLLERKRQEIFGG